MAFWKQITAQKISEWIKKLLWLVFNPRLLLCLLIAWMITNGWSYILLGIGILFRIPWMQVVAGTYLSLLWIPFTPEKIVTVAIAIFLLRVFFPKDEKTLGVLRNMFDTLRQQHRERKEARKQKKAERRQRKAEQKKRSDP